MGEGEGVCESEGEGVCVRYDLRNLSLTLKMLLMLDHKQSRIFSVTCLHVFNSQKYGQLSSCKYALVSSVKYSRDSDM